MIKFASPETEKFHNFKCGEIYCRTSTTYSVACCLCDSKIEFDRFLLHFQQQHLSLLEEQCIDINEVNQVKSQLPEPMMYEEFSSHEYLMEEPMKTENCLKDPMITTKSALMGNEEDDGKPDAQLLALKVKNASVKREIKKNYKANIEKCEEKETNRDIASKNATLNDNDDWSFDDISNNSDEEVPKQAIQVEFSCTECSLTYKSKRSLANHMSQKHKVARTHKLKHKCDECGGEFRTEKMLTTHKYKHTGVFCDICGKPFSQVGHMIRHKVRHTGIKSFKCKECDYAAYTDKELQGHMMRHTGIWPHICEICGRRCRDRGVLTEHMRRHTGERPAKCEVCEKSFFCGHDLNVHKVMHSTERPFVCDICGSTFQRKKALRVHKKLHSKERNHVCKVCGKGFTMSSGLNSHMRSHDAATIASRSIDVGVTNISCFSSGINKKKMTKKLIPPPNGTDQAVVTNLPML